MQQFKQENTRNHKTKVQGMKFRQKPRKFNELRIPRREKLEI